MPFIPLTQHTQGIEVLPANPGLMRRTYIKLLNDPIIPGSLDGVANHYHPPAPHISLQKFVRGLFMSKVY